MRQPSGHGSALLHRAEGVPHHIRRKDDLQFGRLTTLRKRSTGALATNQIHITSQSNPTPPNIKFSALDQEVKASAGPMPLFAEKARRSR